MINMDLIASLTLNLTPNQMKEKNTDVNTNMKHSFKLLKSIDISIRNVKVQNIYFIFLQLILQGLILE